MNLSSSQQNKQEIENIFINIDSYIVDLKSRVSTLENTISKLKSYFLLSYFQPNQIQSTGNFNISIDDNLSLVDTIFKQIDNNQCQNKNLTLSSKSNNIDSLDKLNSDLRIILGSIQNQEGSNEGEEKVVVNCNEDYKEVDNIQLRNDLIDTRIEVIETNTSYKKESLVENNDSKSLSDIDMNDINNYSDINKKPYSIFLSYIHKKGVNLINFNDPTNK